MTQTFSFPFHMHKAPSSLFCASTEDHCAKRQSVSSTNHCCLFTSMLYILLLFDFEVTLGTVLLALFGHSNPVLVPDVNGFFFLAQQRSGPTLQPLFLAEGRFIFLRNRKTGSKLGTDMELTLELPWWKRGNSH